MKSSSRIKCKTSSKIFFYYREIKALSKVKETKENSYEKRMVDVQTK